MRNEQILTGLIRGCLQFADANADDADHENPKFFTMILHLSNSGECLMIKQRIIHIIPSTTIWFLLEFFGLAILDAAVHVRERKLLKFLVSNKKKRWERWTFFSEAKAFSS